MIDERLHFEARRSLVRLVVAPFSGADAPEVEAAEGVSLIERFVTEELARLGLELITASELRTALLVRGPSDPGDVQNSAQVAARKFGATGLLVGRVSRYRDRRGQGAGATQPASVAFTLALHEAPGGRLLWSGRFDETQVPLSDSPARARRYPGGGMRWLTALQLARWGSEQAAAALVAVK